MAVLNITEFAEQGKDVANRVTPTGVMPPLAVQEITGTTTSVASAELNAKTTFVRVISTTAARIEFGTAPIADGSSTRIALESSESFSVRPNQSLKIAVKDA
jgi:hypothetical protein